MVDAETVYRSVDRCFDNRGIMLTVSGVPCRVVSCRDSRRDVNMPRMASIARRTVTWVRCSSVSVVPVRRSVDSDILLYSALTLYGTLTRILLLLIMMCRLLMTRTPNVSRGTNNEAAWMEAEEEEDEEEE